MMLTNKIVSILVLNCKKKNPNILGGMQRVLKDNEIRRQFEILGAKFEQGFPTSSLASFMQPHYSWDCKEKIIFKSHSLFLSLSEFLSFSHALSFLPLTLKAFPLSQY